jgi:hypothetical protein
MLLGLGCLAVTLCLLNASAPLRALGLLVAACLVPGGAMLTFLQVDGVTSLLAIAVSLSLSVEIAGSLAMVWTHWWHPIGFAVLIGTLAAILLIVDVALNVWFRKRPV